MSLLMHLWAMHKLGNEKSPVQIPIYERHFERFRNQSPVVLEIGVNNGGSLPFWKQYFGANSYIIGMDINPMCSQSHRPNEGVNVFIGDATKPEDLNVVLSHVGQPDIVIDDGSHRSEDIIASFEYLYPRMSRHGVYLAEDLHMCWDEGVPTQPSFIEYAKGLMDETQALFRKAEPRKWFSHSTLSMTVYESIIVFEKGMPLNLNTFPQEEFVAFDQKTGGASVKNINRKTGEVK